MITKGVKSIMSQPVVYLIDDDYIYHSLTEMLLNKASRSFRFKAFKDGKEAIDQLHSDQGEPNELPDLILLDINMPVMNGWEFLDEFANLGTLLSKKPKISMLSSSSLDADITRAKENLNVKDYVTKPLTLGQLEELTADF